MILSGAEHDYGLLLFLSFVFFLPKQMTTMMNLNDSYRFLTARIPITQVAPPFLPPFSWGSAVLFSLFRPGRQQFFTLTASAPLIRWARKRAMPYSSFLPKTPCLPVRLACWWPACLPPPCHLWIHRSTKLQVFSCAASSACPCQTQHYAKR